MNARTPFVMITKARDRRLRFFDPNANTRQGGIILLGQIARLGREIADPQIHAVLGSQRQLQLKLQPPEFEVVVRPLAGVRSVQPVKIVAEFFEGAVLRARFRPGTDPFLVPSGSAS